MSDALSDASPHQLFDFIYRDPDRFASLAAQLYQGRLLSATRSDSTTKESKQEAGAELGAKWTMTGVTSTSSSQERQIDPHDQAVVDVISQLQSGRWLATPASAKNGQFVYAKGTLFFSDSSLKLFAEMAMDEIRKQAKKQQASSDVVRGMDLIKKVMPGLPFPSGFYLHTSSEIISGTIKPSGLDEPVSSYYYKHGSYGLDDIHVIGIKEESSKASVKVTNEFHTFARQAVDVLNKLVFPSGAVYLTPLALFRVLEPVGEQ